MVLISLLTVSSVCLFALVRANQKDSYYQQILKDQVKDAVREIFGMLRSAPSRSERTSIDYLNE